MVICISNYLLAIHTSMYSVLASCDNIVECLTLLNSSTPMLQLGAIPLACCQKLGAWHVHIYCLVPIMLR